MVFMAAINYNADNIKAYYRKAAALKAISLYSHALQVAQKGRQQASSRRQDVSGISLYSLTFFFFSLLLSPAGFLHAAYITLRYITFLLVISHLFCPADFQHYVTLIKVAYCILMGS